MQTAGGGWRVAGDRVELHVCPKDRHDHTLALPPAVATVVEPLIDRLLNVERVAVLSEEQELNPMETSNILGMSRPLIVLQTDRGDLPFSVCWYSSPHLARGCASFERAPQHGSMQSMSKQQTLEIPAVADRTYALRLAKQDIKTLDQEPLEPIVAALLTG